MRDAIQPKTIEKGSRHAGFIQPSKKSCCSANDENARPLKEIEFLNFYEKFQCDIKFAENVAADNSLEIYVPLTMEDTVETIHEKYK